MALRAVSTIGATGGATGTLPVFISGYPNNALTGTTTETNQAAIRIAANTLGPNGSIRITALWSYTNSANNKTISIRFTAGSGAIAGGLVWQSIQTTTATMQQTMIIRNGGVTNAQVVYAPANTPFGSSANALNTAAVDTTADSFVNINGQLALGTETLTLLGYTAEIFHA